MILCTVDLLVWVPLSFNVLNVRGSSGWFLIHCIFDEVDVVVGYILEGWKVFLFVVVVADLSNLVPLDYILNGGPCYIDTLVG